MYVVGVVWILFGILMIACPGWLTELTIYGGRHTYGNRVESAKRWLPRAMRFGGVVILAGGIAQVIFIW